MRYIPVFLLFLTQALAQDFWMPLQYPYAGFVTCVAADPSYGVYAGTRQNGMFRSTDLGNSWLRVPFPNDIPNAMAFDHNGFLFVVGSFTPLWRSTDGGDTWTASNAGLVGAAIHQIIVNSRNAIFVSGDNGIFRSTDRGDHWAPVNTGLINLQVAQVAVAPGDTLFAGGVRSGISFSSDAGDTWLPLTTGFDDLHIHSIVVDSQRTVFAEVQGTGILASSDMGVTWKVSLSQNQWPGICTYMGLDHTGRAIALSNFGDLITRPKTGNWWMPVSTDNVQYFVTAFAVTNDGYLFAGTNGSGVVRGIINSVPWTPVGFPVANVGILLSLDNGTVIAGTENGFANGGGCFFSRSIGEMWSRSSLANVPLRTISPRPDGSLVAATATALLRSTDQGANWTQASSGLTPDELTSAVSAIGDTILTGTIRHGLYKFSGFNSWIRSGLDAMNVLMLYKSPGGTYYAGAPRGLYASANGSSWTHLNVPGCPGDTCSVPVYCALDLPGALLAGSDSAIFRSSDGGANWVSSALPSSIGKISALTSFNGQALYAAAAGGILRSDDNGTSWAVWNAGLSTTSMRSVVYASDGYLYAGSSDQGIFRSVRILADVHSVKETGERAFGLLQNYPNPFNPTTDIGFRMSDVGYVSLKIFDVLGREVATVVNGWKAPGEYKVTFNGANLASGVYYYRLSAGTFFDVKRMIILK